MINNCPSQHSMTTVNSVSNHIHVVSNVRRIDIWYTCTSLMRIIFAAPSIFAEVFKDTLTTTSGNWEVLSLPMSAPMMTLPRHPFLSSIYDLIPTLACWGMRSRFGLIITHHMHTTDTAGQLPACLTSGSCLGSCSICRCAVQRVWFCSGKRSSYHRCVDWSDAISPPIGLRLKGKQLCNDF